MKDLENKTSKQAIEIILKEDGLKKWYPHQLQKEIKKRSGKLYSESGITARLRELDVPAIRVKGKRACVYRWGIV